MSRQETEVSQLRTECPAYQRSVDIVAVNAAEARVIFGGSSLPELCGLGNLTEDDK